MGFSTAVMVRNLPTCREAGIFHHNSSWQGLADDFRTFDWVQLKKELTPFPEFVVEKLGW